MATADLYGLDAVLDQYAQMLSEFRRSETVPGTDVIPDQTMADVIGQSELYLAQARHELRELRAMAAVASAGPKASR